VASESNLTLPTLLQLTTTLILRSTQSRNSRDAASTHGQVTPMGPGSTTTNARAIACIYPHVIAEAKNGHNADRVRFGSVPALHTPEAGREVPAFGFVSISAKEDAADAIAAFEPMRVRCTKPIREADARRETMLAAQRAENAAQGEGFGVDRQAAPTSVTKMQWSRPASGRVGHDRARNARRARALRIGRDYASSTPTPS